MFPNSAVRCCQQPLRYGRFRPTLARLPCPKLSWSIACTNGVALLASRSSFAGQGNLMTWLLGKTRTSFATTSRKHRLGDKLPLKEGGVLRLDPLPPAAQAQDAQDDSDGPTRFWHLKNGPSSCAG